MKVLQVNATYGYTSTGLIVTDIGNALTKNGEEAFFAYQTCLEHPQNGYLVGNVLDWKAHALLCRAFGKQAYFSVRATKALIKHIRAISPDVVHLHNLHSNYVHLNLLLEYLAKENIATVITMHDCWYFTGKCFHYAEIGCDGFCRGCGNCPKKKAPPQSLFFDTSRKVLKDKQKRLTAIPRLSIVGCSDWICGEAKKSILKDCHITRIYNGVDTSVFKPLERNILKEQYGENAFYIMGMANKWLLPANKPLFESALKILNENLKLVLVGCKDDQIQELNKLSPHLIPIGFIKGREELAQYYSSADVFVNATHVDTLPTVNMESICCGTPVITYDSCGSPELILEGCGHVVPKGDAEGLIQKINSVSKIDAQNLNRARKSFDKNNCYLEYLHLYRRLMGET